MKNIGNMLKQAREMQRNMQLVQDKLAETQIEGTSGGGLITVCMTGKSELKSVKIKPEAVDPDDIETLEDLITAAVQDALTKVQVHVEKEMGKVTGGMNIPGLM